MKRIAIEMDEVIIDLNHKLTTTPASQPNQPAGTQPQQTRATLFAEIEELIGEESFYAGLPAQPDAQRVIERLAQEYEIFITTTAVEFPRSLTAKLEWLKANFPCISPMNIICCGSKGILNADYLIDTDVQHFSQFAGESILFTTAQNQQETGYSRVDNWRDIERRFL
ncbi:5'-3'-deoxyribonucleotidase [Candidatus Pantoea deserta]|uniref:5'-3'-deoxyribonucleotidase n=1 Tax=Candidatus Pantoea deserta TaxID=1869313 RepID=A0A3N4NQP2_9GAMM|nr:5'-3'-deoxyribonucleotidase [Pantoea deserta]RPD96877.1 5'-3'-deoxyribonucleotidase [Pantoea deserta]